MLNMSSNKLKYSIVGVLVLFSGLFSVVTVSAPLFAQEPNQAAGNQTLEAMQSAGNQTGEALQTAGNQTGEALQTAGNRTGEGLQAVANETGQALKGAQEFLNEGGQNQGQ
jgi:hypothetical protein